MMGEWTFGTKQGDSAARASGLEENDGGVLSVLFCFMLTARCLLVFVRIYVFCVFVQGK